MKPTHLLTQVEVHLCNHEAIPVAIQAGGAAAIRSCHVAAPVEVPEVLRSHAGDAAAQWLQLGSCSNSCTATPLCSEVSAVNMATDAAAGCTASGKYGMHGMPRALGIRAPPMQARLPEVQPASMCSGSSRLTSSFTRHMQQAPGHKLHRPQGHTAALRSHVKSSHIPWHADDAGRYFKTTIRKAIVSIRLGGGLQSALAGWLAGWLACGDLHHSPFTDHSPWPLKSQLTNHQISRTRSVKAQPQILAGRL
jgi:hypothetical protein